MSIPALIYRHTIVSGEDYLASVDIDADIDLVGASAFSQICDRFGAVIAQFSCAIPNPAAKRINLTLSAIESLKLSEHKHYSHTLNILNGQGLSIYLALGEVVALRGALGESIGGGIEGSTLTRQTKIFFAFGDATPKTVATLPAGFVVFTAQIVIQVPFNGVGATLALGDVDVNDRLIGINQNDPAFAAEYETNPGYLYTAPAQILLTIVPGEMCSQGSGYVLLEA